MPAAGHGIQVLGFKEQVLRCPDYSSFQKGKWGPYELMCLEADMYRVKTRPPWDWFLWLVITPVSVLSVLVPLYLILVPALPYWMGSR